MNPRRSIWVAALLLSASCASAPAGVGATADAGPEAMPAPPPVPPPPPPPPAPVDAGTPPPVDGGAPDAAPPDASTPSIVCTDATSDVYVTPPNLPAMSMAARGAVVRCSVDGPVAEADVVTRLAAKSVTGVTATTGTTIYRIAYRTYREDGVAGVSTARVYLPMVPRSSPLPVVAVGHPTEGIAASCAPSMTATDLDDLALPFAARGFAVIASDYAGLGNGGVQGYAANHDTAHSLLDSARALRSMLDPRALDDRVLLVGYSQGGGAVLAAQGLAASYGAGGTVVAGVVFAAEYFGRMNSFGYVNMLQNPTELTIETGISMPVVAAMRDYAYGSNILGASSATALFPASQQSGMSGAITTLCQTPFGGYLQGVAVHVGDIFDPTFTSQFLGCVGATGACAGAGQAFYSYLQGDLVAPDPNGAPLLYLQGLADVIMPPASEAACNLGLLQSAGVPVQLCVDPPAMHTDITARDVGFAEAWSEAKLDGLTLPSCSSSGMPACTP